MLTITRACPRLQPRMTDHRNTEKNKDKVGKYGQNYQNVTQRHEVGKTSWKNDADRLAGHRAATNLQFVKNARKQSTMKGGVPAFSWLSEHQTGRSPPAAGALPPPDPLLPCPFLLASECGGPSMAASNLRALNALHPLAVLKCASSPAHVPGRQTSSPKCLLHNSPRISNKPLTLQSNTEVLICPANWLLSQEPRLILPEWW